MMELYAGGAAATAVFMWTGCRPRSSGEWIAAIGIIIAWPIFLIYCFVSRDD